MDAWAKWVYSSNKIVLRIFSISYFQKWAGEIAPIWGKNAGLFALLRIVKINHYSIPALTPFPIM
jgi:hypothetical protein